jgi:acyl-coenzyme A synthetase/AMP-(fatty) acid ligase
MLSHLNALTFVNWGREAFQLTHEDILSNHAPFIFDLSVFDIYCGIKAGAAISLIPEGTATIPTQLSKMIEEHRISVWYSVPSVLTLLLLHGALHERDLSRLRMILYAGEVFPVKFLRQLMEVLPHPRYFNLYGPTETNVITYYEIKAPIPEATKSIPIGKACENTVLIAVDENGECITEPGREGLLYAWGSTVTRGYFGRPVETTKAFLANPFVEGREEKLYATGDWVTLDEQGNYIFIGRKDHQIKTRGYRVELGDIEAVLYANPAIHEAVAIPIPDDLLGNTIKAVIVPAGPDLLTEQDVKRHVASSLPRYMVPETVEFRTALPRTATDKVDRPRLVAESVNGKRGAS